MLKIQEVTFSHDRKKGCVKERAIRSGGCLKKYIVQLSKEENLHRTTQNLYRTKKKLHLHAADKIIIFVVSMKKIFPVGGGAILPR